MSKKKYLFTYQITKIYKNMLKLKIKKIKVLYFYKKNLNILFFKLKV